MFAPAFNPAAPDELFAACDMSPFFRTRDLGANWETLPFQQIQSNRSARVQFSGTPPAQVLYCIDHAGEVPHPEKSTDGGDTWNPLAVDPTGGEAYSLFADPADPNRLLVSDWCHLYYSGNGGASWATRFENDCGGNGLHVGGAFFDGTRIFVGTNAGLLVSTDGGTTFNTSTVTGIPSGRAIVSFCGAKEGETVRLFALTTAGDLYGGINAEEFFWSHQEVYVIDWGAASWSARNTGLPTGDGNGLAFIACALADIDTAYVSGQRENEYPMVYKTTNGGGEWTSVLLTSTNQNIATGWAGEGGDRGWSYGAGTVGFGVSPSDPNRLAFTDYGFLHLSIDGGATWRQGYLNPADQNPANTLIPKGKAYHGSGLENTSCWWLTWSDSQNIWGSYTDIRGVRSIDAGATWSFDYAGHSENTAYHCVRHPVTGALYMASGTVHDLYESTYLTDARIDGGDGRVLVSNDKGDTWQLIHDFGHPVVWLSLDPNRANTLFASVVHSSAGGIHVSHNIDEGSASDWSKLATPPRTQGHPFVIQALNDGTLVCTYSGRRAPGFTDSSGVFVSTTDGASWVDRSHANMHYWVKDVVIDPHDAAQNTWYVGVWSGWGGPLETNNEAGGLYRTVNRGVDWTRIHDGYRVSSCAVNPASANEMYLTTETDGLWRTTNLGDTAPTFELVGDYPFRHPKRVFFNPFAAGEIWVTSFGNGIRVKAATGPAAVTGWQVR